MRLLSFIYVFSFYIMFNKLAITATLKKQSVIANSNLAKAEFATKVKADVYREAVVTALSKLNAEKNAFLALEQKLIEENDERYNHAAAKIDEILKQLDIKQKASLNNLQSSSDTQLENLEIKIHREKEDEIERIKEEHKNTLEEQKLLARNRRNEIKKEYEEELKSLDDANEQELKEMSDETNQILQELKDEENEKISDYIDQSQSRLDSLSEVNNEVLENIVENFNLDPASIDEIKREVSDKLYPTPNPNEIPTASVDLSASTAQAPSIGISVVQSEKVSEPVPSVAVDTNQIQSPLQANSTLDATIQADAAQSLSPEPAVVSTPDSNIQSSVINEAAQAEVKTQDQSQQTSSSVSPATQSDQTEAIPLNNPTGGNTESFSLVF